MSSALAGLRAGSRPCGGYAAGTALHGRHIANPPIVSRWSGPQRGRQGRPADRSDAAAR